MKRIMFVIFLLFLCNVDYSQNDINKSEESLRDTSINESLFKNLKAISQPEAITLNWSIDYDVFAKVKDKQLIIKYNSEIEAKRLKNGYNAEKWKYSKPFDIKKTDFQLNELVGDEKYEVYIGLIDKNNSGDYSKVIWSKKIKEKTERGWGIMKFLILIGSLGLFIFGMKIMSDGMQRTAGDKLRKMLGSITSNRFKGILTGFSTTAVVQSSSVTTVMTVSLVNAGLLNLRQSAGVMMGANIGTTITAWLVLLIGFKVSISSYALLLIAFGAPLLFMSFRKSKDLANAIIGFAILFIGLQFLKDAVPNLDKDSAFVQFFINYKDIPFISNLMFVLLGSLVTIVIQSSSAAMAITMTMVSKGIIPFEVACAMVLGENIGTTVTAELASLVGNVHAKRAARFNSLFNIVGVTWMLIAIPLFLDGIGLLVSYSHGANFNPLDLGMANEGIALFHTLFNCANVIILFAFVPSMVNLVIRTVKSKGDSDEEFKLDYITGTGGVGFPEVAILEAKKEVAKFGVVTARMNGFIRVLLNNQNKKTRNKMYEKIIKYEEITDRVEVEVANYLEKVSSEEITQSSSSHIRSMLSITNDLERIGDAYYQMSKTLERKEEKRLYFLPEQRDNLNKMLDIIDSAYKVMNKNLNSEFGKADLESAVKIENEINTLRDKLRKSYLKHAEKGEYQFQSGIMYNDLYSYCEKVGDFIINVSEAMSGKI